jgi:hypothetical protein
MRTQSICGIVESCSGYVVARLACGHQRQVSTLDRVGDPVDCQACALAEWEQRFAGLFTAAELARLEFARWLVATGRLGECEPAEERLRLA